MRANTRNMTASNEHDSTQPEQRDRAGKSTPHRWPRKFISHGDISFRLCPSHAKELAAISESAGMSPNDVVRDMVAMSLSARMRQRRKEAADGSN